MKVIIGDADEAYSTMLANTIRTLDHEPIILENGSEVLKTYEKDVDISILFLDWNLPNMDGLEVASKLKEFNFHQERDSYVIITGERGGRYDIMNAMEMGANDLITKPFNSRVVEERMETAIDYFLTLPQEIDPSEKDPVENLLDEHGILRFQGEKLEKLLDSVDEEAPNKLINWLSGKSFVLETDIHQEKENQFSIVFMERLINAHGEMNQALSESSSKWVEEEHVKLGKVVKEVRDRFESYQESLKEKEEAPEDYNIMEHVDDFPAFCLKCQKKIVMVEPTIFQMDTGNYAFKGVCPDCDSGVTSIIGKSIGASMKHIALKRTLRRYLKLLNEHLKREEELYFPLAKRYLTTGDRTRLLEEFKDIEKKHGVERMGKDFLLTKEI